MWFLVHQSLNFSLNISAVHIRDKNGVIYAKFEIFAVSPFSNANAQEVKAVADVNIPIQVNPNISFNCKDIASEKITNHDNNTGYGTSKAYEPSGHITKILDQRHSYLVKYSDSYPSGEFAAIQLNDEDSNLFIDGNKALLEGTYGDFCMYEPHYWYKGVNDHKNQILYLLFASKDPTEERPNDKKVYVTDCVLKSGFGAATS